VQHLVDQVVDVLAAGEVDRPFFAAFAAATYTGSVTTSWKAVRRLSKTAKSIPGGPASARPLAKS
jgi:hypothetical protein